MIRKKLLKTKDGKLVGYYKLVLDWFDNEIYNTKSFEDYVREVCEEPSDEALRDANIYFRRHYREIAGGKAK